MFTGIIENTGRLIDFSASKKDAKLVILPERHLADLKIGESIAINGVCLTVEEDSTAGRLNFFVSGETLARTTLGLLTQKSIVNLERSLRADSRLGGHFVMGHVDATGTISYWEKSGE